MWDVVEAADGIFQPRSLDYFIRRCNVNRFIKMVSAVVLGLFLIGDAFAAFTVPSSGYLGYLGNVEDGRYSGAEDIGTGYVWDGAVWVENNQDDLSSSVSTPHWYNFTLDNPMIITGYLELGSNVDSLTISFFDSNDDTPEFSFVTSYALNPHDYPGIGVFGADTWWIKIEGASGGADDSYTLDLSASPVPLPPAILLFVSALAGFGVMGRKKKQLAS